MSIFSAASRSVFALPNVPFNGVTIGQIAQAILPTGATYLSLILACTVSGAAATKAQILAGISYISLKMDGVELYHATGQQAVQISDYYFGSRNNDAGITGSSGFLMLTFERPWMNTNKARRGPAWGTVGQNSFQCNVSLNPDGAIDGLQLYNVTDPVATALGRHVEVRSQSHPFSGTGVDQIIDLPKQDTKNPADCILALHLEVPSGLTITNITNLRVTVENTDFINLPTAIYQLLAQTPTDHRAPPSLCPQYLTIDFLNRNWQSGQLWDTMTALEVRPTWSSAPGNYNILMEILTGQSGTTTTGNLPAVATVPGSAVISKA